MSSDLGISVNDEKSKSVDDVSVLVFGSVFEILSSLLENINTRRIALFVVVVLDVVKNLSGGRNLMVDFDDFTSCTRQVARLLASGNELVFTEVVDLVRVILSMTYRLFSLRYPDIITIPCSPRTRTFPLVNVTSQPLDSNSPTDITYLKTR